VSGSRLTIVVALLLIGGTASRGAGQTPRPFPLPNQPAPAAPATPQPTPQPAAPATASPAGIPDAATLGVPIYPTAQFLASYDAGRGQRYYVFGVNASYADMVNYYRTALKQKGSELFASPPTHQFDTGRFREETMAFPPSVTVKDYTWGGSAGYPNPKPGTAPERFMTLVQIVPVPPGTPPQD
jgi:hypothetical protein